MNYCQRVFDHILEQFYPTVCECGETCTRAVANRPYVLRCSNCLKQKSKLAHTPWRNLRLPQYMAGFLLEESYIRHPKVVTASELQKRFGISARAALNLKRRNQLFACEQTSAVKGLIWDELKRRFKDYELPPEGTDLSGELKRDQFVHADTCALYSTSVRANQGRKRHSSSGLTSSIYMSNKLGGRQVGVLMHVMGTKQGWCLLNSVPDQRADTLGPLIRDALPLTTPIFTDSGYPWLQRVYPHRMVNHSKKSNDTRFRYARDRWCQNGVHNQVAEGLNSSFKNAFSSYRYVRPEYSTLYANEWSFFRNLRYFGMEKLARRSLKVRKRCADKLVGINGSELFRARVPSFRKIVRSCKSGIRNPARSGTTDDSGRIVLLLCHG